MEIYDIEHIGFDGGQFIIIVADKNDDKSTLFITKACHVTISKNEGGRTYLIVE